MDEQNYSQSVYAAIGGEILIKDRCAESFHWDLINWQAIFMDILIKVGWLICSNI